MIFECPGSSRFKEPRPESAACPFCGEEIEIWSDEVEAVCQKCHKTVSRSGTQSCLDWCKHARECVGGERYAAYLAKKEALGRSKDRPNAT